MDKKSNVQQTALFSTNQIKPLAECIYYLVREDFNHMTNHPKLEKNIYFDHALENIKQIGFRNISISKVEIECLIHAAKRRSRLEELEKAVEGDKE